MKREIAALILILFVSGCTTQQNNENGGDENMDEFEKVDFKTDDEWEISGKLLRKEGKAILLIHQLNLNKDSYDSFAKKLNEKGFTVLAIDSRGHGESLEHNGLKRNWMDFSEQDFKAMVLDAKAGKKFLEQEGFQLKGVVGASIGANIALIFATLEPSVEKAVLLSPGLDYRGVEIEEAAKVVRQRVMVVASKEDAYSFGSSEALHEMIANSDFTKLNNVGHGTDMFTGTQLENDLVEWLSP